MSTIHENRGVLAPREVKMKRRQGSGKVTEGGKENLGPGGGLAIKRPRMGTPVRPPPLAITGLQEKIDREYKIRDGAAKLLQASKNPRQSMEASKGLFVSNAKIIALMRELQQRQGEVKRQSEDLQPCKAKIAISEIRVPLEWREFEIVRGKTEKLGNEANFCLVISPVDSHSRFGVFCLLKMGNQVMDTPTLSEVDRTTMDITFRDVIIFPERVGPDFSLEVEVYCSVPNEEVPSKPSTPIKMLKRFRSREKFEDSPSVNSSIISSSPYTPHLLPATPSHRFALAGYTHLTLKDVCGSCRTYKLQRGAVGSSGTATTTGGEAPILPLWGQICCKLMAQPDCATVPRITGFVNMQRMIGGLPDWQRLWCVMRQNHIRCWTYPENVGRKMPVHSIELSEKMSVENAPRLTMRRPNALLIQDRKTCEFFLAFECKEERQQWMTTIQQAILDLQVWKTSCDYIIPIPFSKFYVDSPSMEFGSLPQVCTQKPPCPPLPSEETLL